MLYEESPVDREMIERLLPKLDYAALKQASQQLASICEANSINLPQDLPDELPETPDDALIANLHLILFDIHVLEGHLVCPDTGRKFPIKEGIPNMILHEDEL